MSITFYASQLDKKRGDHVPMFSCDCSDRWCDDCDIAWNKGEDDPPLYTCEQCETEINLSNANAANLLSWLGVELSLFDTIDARTLAAKCRRRLWDEKRNHDAAIPGYTDKAPGRSTLIYNGRSSGYLREKTYLILAIALKAGDHSVSWG